jgi:TonB family protein
MRRRNLLLWILPFLCGILVLIPDASKAKKRHALQSFYVVIEFFSDSLPDSYEEILDVAPQGKDVRVRVVRLSSATRSCGGELLRAAERVLPNTSLKKVVGRIDICSYTKEGVAAALKSAPPKGIQDPSDSAALNIVAKCDAEEKVFAFPYPVEVDLKALHRDNPRVDALWDLTYKVRSRAFGKHFSFYDPPAAQEKEFEDMGMKLLPELVSGKFDAGFGEYTCGNQKCDTNYLAWRLRRYTKPPVTRDPSSVALINASSLHLVKYDPPAYPAIAKSAHILGEVHLRIVADAQTGLVKEVQLVSGNPLLGIAAADAAKKWQFTPGAQSDSPVEALLRFSLCAGE